MLTTSYLSQTYHAQTYARAAEFGILREESESVLNKALKWLGKKIQDARDDPSVNYGDFTEYFITLGVSDVLTQTWTFCNRARQYHSPHLLTSVISFSFL